MHYPHVPEQYQPLLEEWEAILRDEPDPNRPCVLCGEPVADRGKRGPRRLYCSRRCRNQAAVERRTLTDRSDWMPTSSALDLISSAEADGVDYLDAFPGDHPPLNYPVVPRESEPNSEFGWAWEIIGRG
jgi:hypothetical protein